MKKKQIQQNTESEPRIFRFPAFSFLGVAHSRESGHLGAACFEPLAAPSGCHARCRPIPHPTPDAIRARRALGKTPRMLSGGPPRRWRPQIPQNTPHPRKTPSKSTNKYKTCFYIILFFFYWFSGIPGLPQDFRKLRDF